MASRAKKEEVTEEVKQETTETVEAVAISTTEFKMEVSVLKVVPKEVKASKVVVSNLGFGDVYASIDAQVIDSGELVSAGESKEFDCDVFLYSYSRTKIRVEQF
jgi:hypothetical protein